MREESISREAKPFGNGAHITVPSEWIGKEVEVTLLIPDTPSVLDGIAEGSAVSVSLKGGGGEIHGVVENTSLYKYNNGEYVDYEVRCSLDDGEDNYSELINQNDEVDFNDVTEFELIVTKPPNEPWNEDDIYVQFFYGEFCQELHEMAPVEELEFTVKL